MAIKMWSRGVSRDGKRKMSMEEFKCWLQTFDEDSDGKINREELREAIRATTGGWFTGYKSSRAIKSADSNGNGVVEEDEIKSLVEFAGKHLGVKVVGY
ncbi:hypothetical protein SAY86_028747 [Trapa natans]|uniref:EF-hand domain-containing protein n=1 Tax=Trapa natans TaxID=22666 RepID=A0AAN7M019_TRANT|nr:hypothetical protein SAY86_028747 [Trapa natans]